MSGYEQFDMRVFGYKKVRGHLVTTDLTIFKMLQALIRVDVTIHNCWLQPK